MSLAACADLVARGDPDRFAATIAAPVAARSRLLPLYAFNLELARAAWGSTEPMIAEMRLQWWRDALEDAARGVVRGHQVMGPLAALMADAGLPGDVLDRMCTARLWDIGREAHADAAALDAYLDDTAGGLMWLAGRALGAPGAAEVGLREAGRAAGLAAYLRAVPELEARGRVPLLDGRRQAVAALAAEGLARLARAQAALRPVLPRGARPALWAGWQTRGLLRLAVREPGRVASGTLHLPELVRRGGLAWRALAGGW
ncbi:squalene/phytoene synthase family protein [Paracoccaceae bacterium Fryx2]|nr:squalene/phytoene synthase family protein [Paracoccaceae bacterium Fryx2]